MDTVSEHLVRWIIDQATAFDDGASLFEGFCKQLVEAGLPLWRVSVSISAINPIARGFRFEWRPGEPPIKITGPHGPEGEAAFAASPVYDLVQKRETFARWRLTGLQPHGSFPSLNVLRAEGGTDYVLHVIGFAPGTALRGMSVGFATDRPSGFTEDDLITLSQVLPAFGLAVCKLALTRTLRDTLSTYLGETTGKRVLDGQIRRGRGKRLASAILLADLRSFTVLTDRENPLHVVSWLDEHFDALGEPIARHGGEILKFLGDGFYAIFPALNSDARPCVACDGALTAAQEAIAANEVLNERRRAAGEPELAVDLVLHFGEVVYGNVGTSRRLDFTVIGKAVNEASRIEQLCDRLGRPMLLSDAFAERCGQQLELVGEFALRGLDRAQRLWTLPDGS